MQFVYHLCAEDFRGGELLPLKMLAARYPDVYDREIGKWAGRESVLDYVVPISGSAGEKRSTWRPWIQFCWSRHG